MDQINKFLLKQVLLLMVKDHFSDIPRKAAKEIAEMAEKPEKREVVQDHLTESFRAEFEKLAVDIDRIVEENTSDQAYRDAEKEVIEDLERAAGQ